MEITLEQIFNAIVQFNQMMFPAQWAAMLIAILAVIFVFIKKSYSNALIIGVIIFFYLMNALAFWFPLCLKGFPNGFLYMALFFMEAVFLLSAALENELHFKFEPKALPIIGVFCVIYGLIGFPLIAMLSGRNYPEIMFSPLFSSSLSVWLIGLLLMTHKPVPRFTMIVPFIWGLIGVMWVSIGVAEDIGLVIINLLGPALLVYRDRGKRMGLHY